jgi:hypothetical protein
MKVLVIGATGYLGPHVVKALEDHHQLLLTDIKPPKENTRHPFQRVDVSSMEQVQRAAEGMDALARAGERHRPVAPDAVGEGDVAHPGRGCREMRLHGIQHHAPVFAQIGAQPFLRRPPRRSEIVREGRIAPVDMVSALADHRRLTRDLIDGR